MSGLFKPTGASPGGVGDPTSAGGVIVDPTVEITQPGGPFPSGHAILADGLGGYTIDSTLRPYFLSFNLPGQVGIGGTVFCEHQNVDTSSAGVIIPLASNLIAISVSVDTAVAAATDDAIEVLSDPAGAPSVLASISLDTGERTDFRRDLSVAVIAGTELGVRFVQTTGAAPSLFVTGIVNIELET